MIIIKINYASTLPNVAITYDNSVIYAKVVYGDGGGGTATWGLINGTLSDQTDLQNALNAKQDDITLTTIGNSGASTFVGNVLNIPQYTDQYVGTVTSVNMSVPTGLTISGNPITSSGTLAVGLQSGYSIPTTANQANWTTAYNDSITSAAVTGTTTKTLTLNQQDGGTVTASWTDINTDAVTSVFGRTGAVVATEGDYTLTQLGDVTITTPTNGQVLKYNGTTWINNTDTDTGLTSVGLSMPVAFSVANTPLTSNGTLAVTAIGTASQYIRGDGQLATLPSGASGGSSVNYYLNGSVNQGTIGGSVYYEMNRNAVIGAGTDFIRTNLQGDGLIAQFITDANDPNRLEIPSGAWNFEMYFSSSSAGGTPGFYVELLKYNGTTFTSIANGSTNPEGITGGTSTDLYLTSLAVPQTTLLTTDRLAIRVYVITSGKDITLHTEDNNLCEIITTFAGGIAALNGLTANTQYLAIGTSGTDFAISSVSDTHTFNLPTASATNRGALSSADWTTFNNKQNALTNPITGTGTSGQVAYFNGTTSITSETNLFWDAINDRLGIGTASPSMKLHLSGTGTQQISITSTNAGTEQQNFAIRNTSGTFILNSTKDDFTASYAGYKITKDSGAFSINKHEWYTSNELLRMTLDASGDLGLNVTPSAWGSTWRALEFNNGVHLVAFAGSVVPTMILGANNYFDGTNFIYKNTGYAVTRYQQDSGNHYWYNAASGTAGGTITFTERMRLNAAGNIGIGTINGYASRFAVEKGSQSNTVNLSNSAAFLYGADVGLAIGQQGASPYGTWAQSISTGNVTYPLFLNPSGSNVIIGSMSDGGQRLQVTGTSYFSDSVGIGSTSLTGYSLRVAKSLTGATQSFGFRQEGIVQSDVTTAVFGYSNFLITAASSFTLGSYYHFIAGQGTIGTNSAVTNQYGFHVLNSLTGATNNYGFYGDISAATNRWNLFMNGTANNYMAGSLGIGSTALTTQNFRISKTITGNNAFYNFRNDSQVQSDVTAFAIYNYTTSSTAAATFTIADIIHYNAAQGTFGAGSVVTSQTGFLVSASLIGATNNIGFKGSIPSGTNRWNIFMDGTASNYMEGDTAIGTTSLGTATKFTLGGSETAVSAIARGGLINTTLTASANNDVLVGLDISPTFTVGAFTGVSPFGIRINQGVVSSEPLRIQMVASPTSAGAIVVRDSSNNTIFRVGNDGSVVSSRWYDANNLATLLSFPSNNFNIQLNGTSFLRLFNSTGNLVLQNGGTFTDAGYRLDVNGTARVSSSITASQFLASNTNGIALSDNIVGGFLSYGYNSGRTNVAGHNFYNGISTELMRITSGGNVLMGTTTDAGYRLDVNGTARVQSNMTIYGSVNIGSTVRQSRILNIRSDGTALNIETDTVDYAFRGAFSTSDGRFRFLVGTSAGPQETITLFQGTNVGIGVTSDSGFKLDVNGTARVQSKLSLSAGTTSNAQINLASSTAPTSPNDGDIWFDGTDLKMRIGGVTKTFTLV